ncbi:MAG TPA: NAD(P)/FAD-dependent oxidoreductase [Hyphomicrobiaceae bacterium]|nr:NAD(P)/FAD-dependent oxidoreductase [Hyphomicrobiaceae bacterium]
MARPTPNKPARVDHFDVLIIGAGLSGVAAARHLREKCPQREFAILEARDCIGGTWDLFRYPGVRSGSDMFTLGYSFRPWTETKAIADGPSILRYIRATAREHDIEGKIRFNHRLRRASWSAKETRWTLEVERTAPGEQVYLTCNFLLMCSGYYSYQQGFTPSLPGIAQFKGAVIHPQNWTTAIDYTGKRVVVIGSGATAVTLTPELAKSAATITLVQRSPTYVVAWPDEDRLANRLRRWLPAGTACAITRWKNVTAGMYFYRLCKRNPARARAMILNGVRQAVGPDCDVEAHFNPRYNPWEQRLCLAPNGDFFQSIRQGRTTIVTDEIETFVETGLKLRSGRHLAADLVITATGLDLQVFGGVELDVDGQPVDPANLLCYKGVLYSDMPNFAAVTGYSNASWTLKAELICNYVCRLLDYMDRRGFKRCTPRHRDAGVERLPPVDLSSGYLQRALHKLPKQGSRRPWRIHQNYLRDLIALRYGPFDDGVLEFAPAPPSRSRRFGLLRKSPTGAPSAQRGPKGWR